MDAPKAPGPLKKVPKWAWIASAGVIGGVVVMRMRSNNGSQTDKSATADATAPADYGQTAGFPASGVVTGNSGDGYGGGTNSQVDIPALIDSISNATRPTPQEPLDIPGLITSLGNLPIFAGGGGAPGSGTTQQVPADQPSGAAPAPPVPQAPAPAPQPPPHITSAGPQPKCGGSFPYFDENRGDCYRVQCNPPGRAKGRWHFHKEGAAVKVSNSC